MSQPSQSGRGLGRAGRGQDSKKSSSAAAAAASSSKSTPALQGRAAARAAPAPKPSSSQSQVGEPGPGFPKPSVESDLARKTEGLTMAEGDNGRSAKVVGRGGMRGRRQINIGDIMRTKPESCVSKKGDYGNRIQLLTNYFRIETLADWVLYQYRVDFNVQEDRESVLRRWLRDHKDRLKTAYIFDGTMLFTSQRLTVGNEPLTLTSIRDSDQFPVQIDIKLVQQLNFGNAVYLQVFNILVRRSLLHLNLHLVNRNYFDPKAATYLPQHNLEIWPGYITSIRQHEDSILMCSEITHKVMRTDTAWTFLSECTKEGQDYRRLFQQCMIGAIVLTDYNNKTYRIDDVDFNLNPRSTFKYKNNEEITYVQYYEQRYQIRIRDLRQPLLISRARARDIRGGQEKQCLLVPELCRMTGLSTRMTENKNLMRDLADVTRVSPETRIGRLETFNSRLQNQKEVLEDFKQWGMKISRQLMTVTGREFPPEQLIGGQSRTYSAGSEVDWTRSMRSTPLLHYGRFDNFVVICPDRMMREMEDFLSVLKRTADGMDFRIPRPHFLGTRSDGPSDLLEAVERVLGRVHPDLILFGFTSDRADRYSAIKKKCYVDRGIPSQVVLLRSMRAKGVMSIATKVAIQMNCKIGGAPWTVHIPTENIMVIGFDVCHDAGRKSKSVGAVVASLNKAMSAWFSSVTHHSNGEELSSQLASQVTEAISKYREVNSTLPTRIVVYRDGVGEGQINYVYEHEVGAIKKRLTEIYGSESWKLAYIIVTKKISTRFFYNGRNPRPGTIVDDVVTLPEKYDFYLVSQSVRQGTVAPTSYNVISDNLGWGANHIQRFTYKMTHLYYNCSTTVRVPAPCQYAHKLAFMVSQNLHAPPHPVLQTKLYFL